MTEWRDYEDTALMQAWMSGKTASHIGRLLGRTKNSVIGRARRLGVPPRANPIKRGASPIKPKKAITITPSDDPAITRKGGDIRAALIDPVLPADGQEVETQTPGGGTCQWIEGEPSAHDACKCGQLASSHSDGRRSSWCEEHYPRIFTNRSAVLARWLRRP